MLRTIKHGDACKEVVVAKLLTEYLEVKVKVEEPEAFVVLHDTFDADFVAFMCIWQRDHGLTADGEIGPKTWAAIAKDTATCSTAMQRISHYTLALQLLIDSALTADAVFGKRTKAAVVAYQTAKGLDADGICGPKTWAALLLGEVKKHEDAPGIITKGVFNKPENFKQHDPRWGKKMYSNHGSKSQTMSNSGCGPTAMADIVAYVKDRSVTPWTLAQLAMKWGDRTTSSGTAVSFFSHIQAEYNFPKMIGTKSLETVKACLDAGGYVVCRMGPGYWTNGGHYICAWKYDDKYIYCNDPSSPTSKRAERTKQLLTDFVKQRKDFWCFFRTA